MRHAWRWALAAVLGVCVTTGASLWLRQRSATAALIAEQETIATLEGERRRLHTRLSQLLSEDRRLAGMPDTPVRIGVPTSLARNLVERVVAGLLDQVTLEVGAIRFRSTGTVRKVVTLGHWTLEITVNRVSATLRTRKPDMRFGGNIVRVSLPLELAKGSGKATVHFRWDGRNVSGAICGDLAITREVDGTVAPVSVPATGSVHFAAVADRIVATPHFPPTTVHLLVRPTEESWKEFQEILDAKRGVCGFVLDRVDIRKAVESILTRGLDVRLPTERLGPMAIPVMIEPSITVRGQPMSVAIRLSHLTITEEMIWLGPELDIRNLTTAARPLPEQ